MKEEIQGKLDIQFDAKKEAPTQEPVMCLGMEFENDEARRAYFREELRKKLPELKKIEGYPIGEDDDIINLSDPPYYTACPNPWLNDFIAEWEKEKEQLEREGKRSENFEVTEPYASDVSEGKNNPIYNAHSYHTKVPHPAIMRYIMHYTQPGDIVLDGFAGTGMTGVAAQMCGVPDSELRSKIDNEFLETTHGKPVWGMRHAIQGDLSSIASFIAYNYNSPVDVRRFETEAKQIIAEVEKECGWMYVTKHKDGTIGRINYVVWSDVFVCPDCGGEIVFFDEAVDRENATVKDCFNCPHCGAVHSKKSLSRSVVSKMDDALNKVIQQAKSVPVLIQYVGIDGKRYEKKPDVDDLALIEKIDHSTIPYWFPSDVMCEGKEAHRNDKDGITHVHHFYTKRSLWVLAAIRNRLKDKFKILNVFDSISVFLTSKLVRYNQGKRGNGNLAGTLYVPSLIAETNVFKLFSGKIGDFTKALSENRSNVTTLNSATSFLLNDNVIDYIFTDPPFGANIMYSELNFMQESWLKVKTNDKEEAIEDESHHKNLFDYGDIMQRCFKEYYRVLKPGRWMTVEFSNTSASVWNSLQYALVQSGFVVANVAALDKQQGSFKAVTTTTAVKQDLVITCYKPSEVTIELFNQGSDRSSYVWDFIDELLHHLPVHVERNNTTTVVLERSPKILFDRLISYYVQHGYSVPMDAVSFQAGLRERYMERDGMFFTADQAAQYEQKRNELPNGVQINAFMVSSEADGIQWLKNKLYDGPMTYQELQPEWMQAIAGVRKGDILPELRDLLEQNFIKEADGHWRLPNANDERDLEILRTKTLLREFNLYVEQAAKPKAKLKEVRVEALRAGFKQCYMDKEFATIVMVGDKIPENLLTEDEVLLQYYDIASSRV